MSVTSDDLPGFKTCKLKMISNGENLPCSPCISLSNQKIYSNLKVRAGNDRLTWSINNIKNSNLRSLDESPTANTIM